ncbi:hypothetical protein DPMN_144607 [Dreissena polymorpha]|uniref:Uncharacterized protein n=1 Tax=Dreissena polymorpha TaxID=45954 RepID=A0A9D4F3J1_DREPO|nr:hypothetical protein DPMN_144607 [Dreissena polymorpha]
MMAKTTCTAQARTYINYYYFYYNYNKRYNTNCNSKATTNSTTNHMSTTTIAALCRKFA